MNTEGYDDYEDSDIVDSARSFYQVDGQVEIDDMAQISRGEDGGCYVQAWLWVDFPLEFKKES